MILRIDDVLVSSSGASSSPAQMNPYAGMD